MKLPAAVLAALIISGCAKNIDTADAVRQAVIRDIGKRVDINSMDVNVVSVRFRGNEAEARISYTAKGGNASQSITMDYGLERQGDEWHVKSRDMQHQQPTAPTATGGSANLPPGHPALGGESQLPAGHPPLGSAPSK